MVSAVILMNIARGKVQSVGEALAEVNGITEIFSVGGQWDLIALVRTKTNEQLADLVAEHFSTNEHIAKTETLIAFKVFSKEDMSNMFSIGMDE